MVAYMIIACEIGFWLFIIAGLVTRYILKKSTASLVLLACTPLIDVVLLAAALIDLRNGASASFAHGLAAIYIGVSVVYGRSMIRWADRQFAYRYANGEKPLKRVTYGADRAREEWIGWSRHFLSWLIGCTILLVMIGVVDGFGSVNAIFDFMRGQVQMDMDEPPATFALIRTVFVWTLVLAIDLIISSSYTLFPKRKPEAL